MIGQDKLHRQLASVPGRILAEVKPFLEIEAEKIVREMRSLIHSRSGALAASIGWTWGDVPAGAIKIGSVDGKKYGTLSISIFAGTRDKSLGSADAFYARWVEFGTTAAAASPYFFPVFRANRKRIKAGLSRLVRRAMQRSNGK